MWWGSIRQHTSSTLLFMYRTTYASHGVSSQSFTAIIVNEDTNITCCFCNCSSPLSTHTLIGLNYPPQQEKHFPAAERARPALVCGSQVPQLLEPMQNQPGRRAALTYESHTRSVLLLRLFLSLKTAVSPSCNKQNILFCCHCFSCAGSRELFQLDKNR